MGMHGLCKKLTSFLVLASGVALSLSAFGYIPVTAGLKAGGVLLAFYGLSKLLHALHMCGNCNEMCCVGSGTCGGNSCCVEEMPSKPASKHRRR